MVVKPQVTVRQVRLPPLDFELAMAVPSRAGGHGGDTDQHRQRALMLLFSVADISTAISFTPFIWAPTVSLDSGT